MSGFQLVLLWSDLLIWLLLSAGLALGIVIARDPPLRAAWRRVGASRMGMSAAVVLLAFIVVGLLDSVHYRAALATPAGQPVQYAIEVRSLLDVLGEPLRLRNEKTYSAPFATRLYAKETIDVPGQGATRDYPRLRHGGVHLADEADLGRDVALTVLPALALAVGLWLVLVLAVARGQGPAGWRKIWRGETAFAWNAVLATLGFRVTRLCGCVDRPKLGDMAIGNQLTLQVDLDHPYLAEVGVADAIVEPVPMAPGHIRQRGFEFSIVSAGDGCLRLNNHGLGVARTVDFRPGHADEDAIAATQAWLMRDPGSPFTNALAVFRHTEDGYLALQNDRLRRVTAAGAHDDTIANADHLAEVLENLFELDIPAHRDVWDRVATVTSNRAT